MKKIVAAVAVLSVMALTFVGCGSKKDQFFKNAEKLAKEIEAAEEAEDLEKLAKLGEKAAKLNEELAELSKSKDWTEEDAAKAAEYFF